MQDGTGVGEPFPFEVMSPTSTTTRSISSPPAMLRRRASLTGSSRGCDGQVALAGFNPRLEENEEIPSSPGFLCLWLSAVSEARVMWDEATPLPVVYVRATDHRPGHLDTLIAFN